MRRSFLPIFPTREYGGGNYDKGPDPWRGDCRSHKTLCGIRAGPEGVTERQSIMVNLTCLHIVCIFCLPVDVK